SVCQESKPSCCSMQPQAGEAALAYLQDILAGRQFQRPVLDPPAVYPHAALGDGAQRLGMRCRQGAVAQQGDDRGGSAVELVLGHIVGQRPALEPRLESSERGPGGGPVVEALDDLERQLDLRVARIAPACA